jgi:hypothetical protein
MVTPTPPLHAGDSRHPEMNAHSEPAVQERATFRGGVAYRYVPATHAFEQITALPGSFIEHDGKKYIMAIAPDFEHVEHFFALASREPQGTQVGTYNARNHKPADTVMVERNHSDPYGRDRTYALGHDGQWYELERPAPPKEPFIPHLNKPFLHHAHPESRHPTTEDQAYAEADYVYGQNDAARSQPAGAARPVFGAEREASGQMKIVRLAPGSAAYEKQLKLVRKAGDDAYPLVDATGKVVYRPPLILER